MDEKMPDEHATWRRIADKARAAATGAASYVADRRYERTPAGKARKAARRGASTFHIRLDLDSIASLELVGSTNSGAGFSAVDCVRLVPPGTPPGVLLIGANLPGVWVDVTPLDDALDEGGWTSFNRQPWAMRAIWRTAFSPSEPAQTICA